MKPAKAEFLPVFDKVESWYSVTVMCRSNPTLAGVKIEVGRDVSGNPIFNQLFRLTRDFPRQPKFGLDALGIPSIVSEGLYEFMNWLTDGRYFDGLHAFRDISYSYFPDPSSPLEVNHTVNCHYHAYGNTSRQFTPADAQRMWFGCVKKLFRASNTQHQRAYDDPDEKIDLSSGYEHLYAYPDIVIRPLPTVGALAKAIDYVIKPFKLADCYIRGLEHGCPVRSLNHEFHQTAMGAERGLFGPPEGCAFGNMSQRSGDNYIGVPRPKEMTEAQVQRFLEKLKKGEISAWEMERHDNHLTIVEKKKAKL